MNNYVIDGLKRFECVPYGGRFTVGQIMKLIDCTAIRIKGIGSNKIMFMAKDNDLTKPINGAALGLLHHLKVNYHRTIHGAVFVCHMSQMPLQVYKNVKTNMKRVILGITQLDVVLVNEIEPGAIVAYKCPNSDTVCIIARLDKDSTKHGFIPIGGNNFGPVYVGDTFWKAVEKAARERNVVVFNSAKEFAQSLFHKNFK